MNDLRREARELELEKKRLEYASNQERQNVELGTQLDEVKQERLIAEWDRLTARWKAFTKRLEAEIDRWRRKREELNKRFVEQKEESKTLLKDWRGIASKKAGSLFRTYESLTSYDQKIFKTLLKLHNQIHQTSDDAIEEITKIIASAKGFFVVKPRYEERDAEIIRLNEEDKQSPGRIRAILRRHPTWGTMQNGNPITVAAIKAVLTRAKRVKR